MSYTGIYSLIIGAAAGFLANLLAERILLPTLKNRAFYKSVITSLSFIIFTGLGNALLRPSVIKLDAKGMLAKQLSDLEKTMPAFTVVKEKDPQAYDKFLSNGADLVAANPNATDAEMGIKFYELGHALTKGYTKRADDHALRKLHLANIKLLKELSIKAPDAGCRMLFPYQFGMNDPDDLNGVTAKADLMAALKAVLESGIKSPAEIPNYTGPYKFADHRQFYFKQNPAAARIIQNFSAIKTREEKQQLINSFVGFAESILKLPAIEAAILIRQSYAGG